MRQRATHRLLYPAVAVFVVGVFALCGHDLDGDLSRGGRTVGFQVAQDRSAQFASFECDPVGYGHLAALRLSWWTAAIGWR